MRIAIVLSLFMILGCTASEGIKEFKSDACSLFPDRSLITEKDWCYCCFEHDIAYWKGGTEEERLKADIIFRDCIEEMTGNKKLAKLMYTGVRFGGSPYFYTWYKWGYGWDYGRKYTELSEEENQDVARKIIEYIQNEESNPCQKTPYKR